MGDEGSALAGRALMSSEHEAFWSTLPEAAAHPLRVPILEALWRTGRPLSAIDVVDVLDGHLSMREAAYHLHVLAELGVVERLDGGADELEQPREGEPARREDRLDVRYRLREKDPDDAR